MISWEAERWKGIAPPLTLPIPPPLLKNGPNKHTPCHWDVVRWGEDLAHRGNALTCSDARVSCDFPLNREQYYLNVFLSLLSRWNLNAIGLLYLCVVGITGLHAFLTYFFIPLRTNIHASLGGVGNRSENTKLDSFFSHRSSGPGPVSLYTSEV